MDINAIEKALSKALSLNFFPSDNPTQKPPVAMLVFRDRLDAGREFDILIKNSGELDFTLLIKPRGLLADISLIDKKKGEILNIKSIAFKIKELDDFILNIKESKGRFAFFVAEQDTGEPIIIQNPETGILVMDSLQLSN